ncbi:hypothetical protein K1T71_007799 [Dendrolimus kikuchii]|uniref:Uncharacterized protein n=1 Tax=Dendrolimus kikuchii TaxID=765133 RepID=A0ACC1CYH8_9NEOP|nr:hypothetical protein K1T71_007799 [Dendrolimus kikuchii]
MLYNFFILQLLLVVNQCFYTTSRRVKRVIRGTEVECGEQPRVTSLLNSTSLQHLCGAVLLSPNFALTAAHCVHFDTDQYLLQLNNYCVEDTGMYPKAEIFEIITNNRYNIESRAHDIALLRITVGMDDIMWLNDTVLPASSFGVSGDCKVYGYGFKNLYETDTSETLLEGKMRIVSLDECTEKLGPHVAPKFDSGMMCAVGDGVDSCQGDSGSPLICNGFLEGICSYGMSCGVSGLPGVYTGIGAHLNWIHNIIHLQLSETD